MFGVVEHLVRPGCPAEPWKALSLWLRGGASLAWETAASAGHPR